MKPLALALLTLVPLAAQVEDQAPIRLDVTRVSLMFTVQDKKGRFLTDLGKEEFEVIENKRPQSILEFTAESNLPLRLAILIDTSNSIRDRFKFQQEAAISFVDTVVRRGIDKAMVVSFDTTAELVADLTDDPEKLQRRHSQPAAGGRYRPLRRHLLRVPGQADSRRRIAGEVPARRGRPERRRRQFEPLDARPGP